MIRSNFGKFINWWIAGERIEGLPVREKIFVQLLAVSNLIGLVFCTSYLTFLPSYDIGTKLTYCSLIVFCSASLWALKKSKISTKLIGSAQSVILYFILIKFSLLQETYYHGTYGWFFLPVVFGFIYHGPKLGFALLAASIAVIIFTVWKFYNPNGIDIPSNLEVWPWTLHLVGDYIFALTLQTVTIYFVYVAKYEAEEDINTKDETISKQHASIVQNSRFSELGKLAGKIGHEINTPLTVIKLSLSMAMKKLKKNELTQTDYESTLQAIEKTSLRIEKIVKSLKNYQRDGSSDPLAETSLGDTLEEVSEIIAFKVKFANIKFEIKDNPYFTSVWARQVELDQVLLILLNNAIDALEGQENASIYICFDQSEEYNIISVVDSGSGIPREHEDLVMQPYFTTKEHGKGSGVGLSIALELTQKMLGDLKIDRSHNDSRISIYLRKPENEKAAA